MNILLESKDLDINKITSRGSALHLACRYGFKDIVERLLEAGADPSLEDNEGNFAILLTNNLEILELIPKYIGKNLLKKYSKIEKNLPLSFSGIVH